MIKVNLLATNPGAAAPREWLPREQRSALGGVSVLIVTALGLAGYWYYQGLQRTEIETQVAAAQTELVRLKEAAAVVERTNARRTELSERLALIDRLRASKRAPVSLLETVSYSVPEGLWLLEIKQSAATVQIDGRATSITAITDFTERLQNSGYFLRPVEIMSTATEAIDETGVVRFVVKAEVVPPQSPAEAAAVPGVPPTIAGGAAATVPGA
ncbi:MAG: PilN domain-containing protein [Acidobacteria bacterium]|nr:PilN domain-containing protein [Acidobacteriota bacterium]